MDQRLRTYPLLGLVFFVLLEVMLAAAILYWPEFEKNVGAIKMLAPLDVLKDMVDTLAQGGVEAYVNGQHFFKGVNTLGLLAAVLFSCGAVAGEVHRGTLEIWLARPFSRRRLLLSRYAAGALALVVPIFATSATIPWLLTYVDQEMALAGVMLCAVHASVFALMLYSFSFLLSSLASNPMPIALGVLMVSIFEFAIYLVKGITHWSLFRLVDFDDYAAIMSTHGLDLPLVGGMLAASALMLLAAERAFARRVP
ncbi:MAG: ABC transporter permease [Planctomycetes bacterium]|nr:ABC transporter permease [Planctomycetota bacterium]